MGVWIWLALRELALIFAGVLLIMTEHHGWAAIMFLFFLLNLASQATSMKAASQPPLQNELKDKKL
jgi:hypothetical protein